MKRLLLLTIAIAMVSVAHACNIPVFRYALERWRPDECEVIVFYQKSLTPQQESMLAAALPVIPERGRSTDSIAGNGALESGSPASDAQRMGEPTTGARVVRVNIDDSEARYRDIWLQLAEDASNAMPHVVVRAKIGIGRTVNAWHGPLDSIAKWDVFASPARSELAKRLLSGHAVVWVVITADDEARNAAVKKMLAQRLETLGDKIELPDGIGLPGSELYSEIPLLVKFSSLEIQQDDPKEKFLVNLFSRFRPDSLVNGEPLVIPVFGRGRALEVIPAGELNDSLVEDLTSFLSGACSCQVKEQNPGFDLLLSVDWNAELFGEGFEPPPAKSVGDRSQPQLLTIPPGR